MQEEQFKAIIKILCIFITLSLSQWTNFDLKTKQPFMILEAWRNKLKTIFLQ